MPKGQTSKTIAQRREEVLTLRSAGAPYAKIAKAIALKYELPKYDKAQAYKDIKASLRESIAESPLLAEEYRQSELMMADDLLLRLQPRIKLGEVPAIMAALRISEHRARLTGANEAIKVRVEQAAEELHTAKCAELLKAIQSMSPPEVLKEVVRVIRILGESDASF